MLIKAYLKRHMFHLPMAAPELLEQVETALNKKVDKENIYKTFPITKVEDNENILIDRQNTNIFLLNLLLSVFNHKEIEITEPQYYNYDFIISKLEEVTQLDLQGLPFEAIENEVGNYINPTVETPIKEAEGVGGKEDFSYLKNVAFNVDWLKGAQQEINQTRKK